MYTTNGWRFNQQAVAGISHISFAEEEAVSPKKPTAPAEVAKQRELSGTLDSESEAKLKKQFSDAKCKELSGHDIFAPPPEIHPRPLAARALALRETIEIGESAPINVPSAVKVSNVSELVVFLPWGNLEKSMVSSHSIVNYILLNSKLSCYCKNK